jgi:hypothetical protein
MTARKESDGEHFQHTADLRAARASIPRPGSIRAVRLDSREFAGGAFVPRRRARGFILLEATARRDPGPVRTIEERILLDGRKMRSESAPVSSAISSASTAVTSETASSSRFSASTSSG